MSWAISSPAAGGPTAPGRSRAGSSSNLASTTRADPDWRTMRTLDHAHHRAWIMQHTRSLGMWVDEFSDFIPWEKFPVLKHLTLFWPFSFFTHPIDTRDVPLCEHAPADVLAMAQSSIIFDGMRHINHELVTHWAGSTTATTTTTIRYDVPHLHSTGLALWAGNCWTDEKRLEDAEFHKLEC